MRTVAKCPSIRGRHALRQLIWVVGSTDYTRVVVLAAVGERKLARATIISLNFKFK